jgi:gamma-glutamylcyclotransferase
MRERGRDVRPYSWYKRFVLQGARQRGLSVEYIAKIEALVAIEDPNRVRDAENRNVPC